MSPEIKYRTAKAYILGSGFSTEAGLPTTDKLAGKILSIGKKSDPLDASCVNILKKFLTTVFAWTESSAMPTLEDIFTVIDQSANTGHSLGIEYSPRKLRALRRILIYRIFVVLNSAYHDSDIIKKLLSFELKDGQEQTTHFITLNWDSVLEKHIDRMFQRTLYEFRLQDQSWDEARMGPAKIEPEQASAFSKALISHVHGSINWLYCENCRRLWICKDINEVLEVVKARLQEEVMLFNNYSILLQSKSVSSNAVKIQLCHACGGSVSPLIATFSYKKSFRTQAFASSWLTAEQVLTLARKWVFIGYSLPEADYEFKHLLKTCQLKCSHIKGESKSIDVVLKDDVDSSNRYLAFFGNSIGPTEIYQSALEGYVNNGLCRN